MARYAKKGKKDSAVVSKVPTGSIEEILAGLSQTYSTQLQATRTVLNILSMDVVFRGMDPDNPDSYKWGIPRGKIVELFSPEGVGKTTVAMAMAVALAREGYRTVFIDAEHSLDISLVYGMGGEEYLTNGFITVLRANTYKAVEEILKAILSHKYEVGEAEVAMIVIDSITSVQHSTIMDPSGDIEKIPLGLNARTESIFLPKYKALCAAKGVTLLLLTQMRTKLDLQRGNSTVEASGSHAKSHYADLRIGLSRSSFIEEGERRIGSMSFLKAYKNKMDCPYTDFPIHIIFGRGPSNHLTVAYLLVQNKLIKEKGSWYEMPDGASVQGKGGIADRKSVV